MFVTIEDKVFTICYFKKLRTSTIFMNIDRRCKNGHQGVIDVEVVAETFLSVSANLIDTMTKEVSFMQNSRWTQGRTLSGYVLMACFEVEAHAVASLLVDAQRVVRYA